MGLLPPSGREGSVTALVAAAIAAACALSACGGVASRDASRVSDCSVLKIGGPNPLTGVFAESGTNAINGMQLAAEQINNAGGIKALDGTQVQIIPGDTAFDPAQAASVTTKLVESDGVSALVGSYLSGLTLATSTAAEKARVPLLSQSWIDELSSRGYRYYFQPPAPASITARATSEQALAAIEADGKTIGRAALVTSTDALSTASVDIIEKDLAGRGIVTGDKITFQPGVTDATSIANGAVSREPDVIFLAGGGNDVAIIVKAIRARGVNVPIIGTSGAYLTEGIKDALGDQVNGLMSVSAWNDDLKIPEIQEASALYTTQHNSGMMPMEAGESWNDVHLIAAAAEVAASCDPTAIRDALASTTFDKGAAAAMPGEKVAFDERGLAKDVVPVLAQWQGGELRTIYPEKYATSVYKGSNP